MIHKKSCLNDIIINLKPEGSNTRIYLANKDKMVNKLEEIKMKFQSIFIKEGLDYAKKIKKYYINLFQQLGVTF